MQCLRLDAGSSSPVTTTCSACGHASACMYYVCCIHDAMALSPQPCGALAAALTAFTGAKLMAMGVATLSRTFILLSALTSGLLKHCLQVREKRCGCVDLAVLATLFLVLNIVCCVL